MLLTVKEVSERLHVSESLIYQLVETGRLPHHRIGNGRGTIRFRPEDIDGFLGGCRVEQSPAVAKPPSPKLKHIKL